MILTIDGPAGAGKSTVAKKVAARLGLNFLDTGALYRAVAWALSERNISPDMDLSAALAKIDVRLDDGKVFVNGEDVSLKIRTPEIDRIVSPYSALPQVRQRLLGIQREQNIPGKKGLVAEGRDVGSAVFPDADVKIFLTAGAEERANRRYKERIARGEAPDYTEILASVIERDRIDSSRDVAPLTKPDGAHVVDSSNLTEQQVIGIIVGLAEENLRNS